MHKEGPLYQLFRKVFFQYYQPLCQYAFTLVKDTQASEDIVQDILLKVWEKKQDLIGKEEMRFYLFTAVRNNCLTILDKQRKSIFVELTGQEAGLDALPVAGEKDREVDFSVLVSEALDRLPPKCREVFVLSRMSKLTYQQIADTSGISVKTVENQMGKALGIMRSFVKEKQAFINSFVLFISFIFFRL